MDLASNSRLTSNHLQRLLIIMNSDTYDDYKLTYARRRNNSLKRKNEKIARDIEKADKKNRELESSSSWKVTKPMRKVLDKIRK